MKKLAAVSLIAIMLSIIPSSSIYAAVDNPDTFTIDQVEVYRNALELNDQLYIITYTIEYGVNPTEGSANDLFILRLLNGATELGTARCSNYYDDGYDTHIMSIYFSATDAPAWNGAYTMYLQGQPTYTWTVGTPPSINMNAFSLWYDGGTVAATSARLEARLIVIANMLEADWGIDLIETIAKGPVLTVDLGEVYFTGVINKLRTIAPDIFADSMVAVDYVEETYTQTYANTLANRLTGTLYDFTNAASAFSLSRMWFNSLVWMFLVMGTIMFSVIKMSNSFKPALLAGVVLVPVGALAGFIPLLLAVGMTFAFGLIIIYAYFYSKTA